MKSALIFLLAILLSSCTGLENKSNASKPSNNTNFYQHWVHSYEEQASATTNANKNVKKRNVFRPAGSRQFPSSRFRMEFGFDPNGQCNYKYLSPTDQHEMRGCIYTKIGNKVYIYNDAGKLLSHLSFTLQGSTQKDKMEMRYGVAPIQTKQKIKK